MKSPNPYCDALNIPVPRLEAARESRDANSYGLLIVALLERGEPMTLEDVARRFEEAGVAPADRALASLKRCNPGRPPIYRDGDHYALDPHDHETDFWAFRLGLKPSTAPILSIVRPDPGPLPSGDDPITLANLEEVLRDEYLNWSPQRFAICVLDARDRAMQPHEILTVLGPHARRARLSPESPRLWRQNAIRVLENGAWELDRAHDAVRSARRALRDRLAVLRRNVRQRPDPVVMEATQKHHERERQAHAALLARMRRVIVHAYPPERPEAVVLLDVGERELVTSIGPEIAQARERLARYDQIAAVNVRAVLRALDFDPGDRRVAELAPAQKTMLLNRQGRTLKITLPLLVQGSCGIPRPFAEETALRNYLRRGDLTKLRRRLESDAKSLFALYQYGRLHRTVRVRWGFLDEMISAPWVHTDEPALHNLKEEAFARNMPLEIVTGSAPGWSDPWSRARRAIVVKAEDAWNLWIVDEKGWTVDEDDIQAARLVE
jgi:hypothetical protein